MVTNENVNVEAMYRAQVLMFGADTTMMVAKLADVIDQAMRDGYDLGKLDAEENVEERLDAAFDEGFEQGVEFAEVSDDDEQNELQDLFAEHYAQLEEFDLDLVRDSGDETAPQEDPDVARLRKGDFL